MSVEPPLAIRQDVAPDDNSLGLGANGWAMAGLALAFCFAPVALIVTPVVVSGDVRLHGASKAAVVLGALLTLVSSFVAIGGVLGWLVLFRRSSRFLASVAIGRPAERPDGTLVLVEGRVAADAPTVASPFLGEPCVVGVLRIEHKHINTRTGPSVVTREASVPFVLQDGEVSIHVKPESALVRGWAEILGDAHRQHIDTLLDERGLSLERRWYTVRAAERRILPGQRVSVLGVLRRAPDTDDGIGYRGAPLRLELVSTPDARLLVTSESPEALRRAVSGRAWLKAGVIASVLLALGYAMLLVGNAMATSAG